MIASRRLSILASVVLQLAVGGGAGTDAPENERFCVGGDLPADLHRVG